MRPIKYYPLLVKKKSQIWLILRRAGSLFPKSACTNLHWRLNKGIGSGDFLPLSNTRGTWEKLSCSV